MLKTGPANIRYDAKRRSILNTVVKNFDYFRAQPIHLAWGMMYWNGLTNVARKYDKCHDNPKYSILDAELESEKDKDLLYGAWGISYAHAKLMDAPADWPLYGKQYKTLEQWIELKTDPKYPYSSLYPTKDSIIDNLLLGCGAGFGWTPEGYIDELGGSEVSDSQFYGYTRCENEVRSDLRAKILDLFQGEECKFILEYIMEWVKLHTSANWPELAYRKKLAEMQYRDPKKIVATAECEILRRNAYLDRLLEEAERWSSEQWTQAQALETYVFYEYPLRISELFQQDVQAASYYGLPSYLDLLDTLDLKKPEDQEKFIAAQSEEKSRKGWVAVKHRVEQRLKQRGKMEAGFANKEPYPRISEYSPIASIPGNAHFSYRDGCKLLCEKILAESTWHPSDRDWAKKILQEKFQIES